jgi:hypothetical protein
VGIPTVTIQSNKLSVRKSSGGSNARVNLIPDIGNGDFDIQVDWETFEGPAINEWYIHMSTWDQYGTFGFDGMFMFIARGYWGGQHAYRTWVYQDGGPGGWWNTVVTTDTFGKFRITRVGDVWTSYYWNGTSWTLHHQEAQVAPIGLVQPVEFRATRGGASPTVEGRFDNFCTYISSYTTTTTTTTSTTTSTLP